MWLTATAGAGMAYEHTEFTSGKEIRQAASNAGIGLKYDYDTTFFRFADYRTGAENAMQGAASGRTVSITHSDHYKTSFRYDPQARTYKMQMYSRISGKFENTVDELNAKQLSFDNLLVCFAPIERYSGDSGDVQQVATSPAAMPIISAAALYSMAAGKRLRLSIRCWSTTRPVRRCFSTAARPILPSWTTTSGPTSAISNEGTA